MLCTKLAKSEKPSLLLGHSPKRTQPGLTLTAATHPDLLNAWQITQNYLDAYI